MSITLNALPDSHGATMEALQRVATHVLARARHTATGRFGLRATPGGFGTPSFGPEATWASPGIVEGCLLSLAVAGG